MAKVLTPVRPNAGIQAEYRKKLLSLLAELDRSVVYWLRASYRKNPPAMAMDDSAFELEKEMQRLSTTWMEKVNSAGVRMAKWFAKTAGERSDRVMRKILNEAGMTVRFKLSKRAIDVLEATTAENVGLIRSIAQEHLADVQGLVMRSVAQGRDVGWLTSQIEKRYGLTTQRAALIARDQNNKATANIVMARQLDAGITKAIWVHSTGGKVPRVSHVKAGREKLIYDVSKGAFIDNEWIYPGQLINCRCVSRSVIEGLDY